MLTPQNALTASNAPEHRKNERGAALVMVLLISTLLLLIGSALILVTTLSVLNTFDATADKQAYYGAEAGLQATLNVLRGNDPSDPSVPAGTMMSFRTAVSPATSNKAGEQNSGSLPRLSGWLSYSVQYTDRVPVSANYTPFNGIAYSVAVSDPDATPSGTEPRRLLIRVTGYGPRNTIKRIEVMVKQPVFDYTAPALLMMRGASGGSPMSFTTGSSAAKAYSGSDNAGSGSSLLAFGVTGSSDEAIAAAASNKNTVQDPKVAVVNNSSLAPWLQSADAARAFLNEMESYAVPRGRFFTSFRGRAGSASEPAFTFVDGDCDLDGGAGLLIVTGNLRMNGRPSFKGLILVLGGGTMNRDGGGNGLIEGAVVVAKFSRTSGDFLAPTFRTNGGGNSTMQYNSEWVKRALKTLGIRVMGVREY